MPESHESVFSYSVTRRYPFKWFTWVVAIGGPVATVVFSLVSYAANGFVPQTVFTTNPNATLDDSSWFQRPSMSWISKVETTCQPQLLSVQNSYFTSNLGLAWLVEQISGPSKSETRYYPSAPYLNSTLKDCRLDEITFLITSRNSRDVNRLTWRMTKATASVSCMVTGPSGDLSVALSTELPEIVPLAASHLYFCLDPVASPSAPSLWLACQLVSYWYTSLTMKVSNLYWSSDVEMQDVFLDAQIGLERNTEVEDLKSISFFSCSWAFWNTTVISGPHFPCTQPPIVEWMEGEYPAVGAVIDTFAKSFYSLILTDLGQDGQSNAFGSSVVANLNYLASHFRNDPRYGGRFDELDMMRDYKDFNNSVRPFDVKPATLTMQYACSVPVRKDTGSIIVSILMTDLIFLQALWTVFSWISGRILARRNPSSNVCAGCAARVGNENYELTDGNRSGNTFGRSKRASLDEEHGQLHRVRSMSSYRRSSVTLVETRLDSSRASITHSI